MLTDDQKVEADRLKLTYTEMDVALKTSVDPERYAKHKADLQAERDAWDAKMEEFAGAAAEGLEHAYRGGRGVALPPAEESG